MTPNQNTAGVGTLPNGGGILNRIMNAAANAFTPVHVGSINDALGLYLTNVIEREQPLQGNTQYQINMNQIPKFIQNAIKKGSTTPFSELVYKNTNGLGNCIVPVQYGGVRINMPGWHYNNADNEWGSPFGQSSGTGVITTGNWAGSTLYRDLATHRFFYVVRHGHHNPTTGLESNARKKKYPFTSPQIANRDYEDALIGSDDKMESQKGKPDWYNGRANTAIVGTPDPNMNKISFMDIVYPGYDHPGTGSLDFSGTSAFKSTFLNEKVDDTTYTPEQNFSSLVSAANLSSQQASEDNKMFSDIQKNRKGVLGRDEQPIDPNFHVFRPINLTAIRTHPDMAAADIIGLSGGKYGRLQAWELIKALCNQGEALSCQGLDAPTYYNILRNISPHATFPEGTPDYVALSIATGKSSFASTPLTKLENLSPYQSSLNGYMYRRQYYYETLLFDFYADNSKFYSGKFDVTGCTGVEYGIRFVWYDTRRQYVWEGYVDGVSHHFYYGSNQPWTTTIDVERALPFDPKVRKQHYISTTTGKPVINQNMYNVNRDDPYIKGNFSERFSGGYWGRQARFMGGFFGEQSLSAIVDQANERDKAYMSHFVNGGNGSSSSKSKADPKSTGSSSIVSYAKSQKGKHPYSRPERTEIASKPNSGHADCSSFVWSVLKHCGYKVSSTPWTTYSSLGSYMHKISYKSIKPGDVGSSNVAGGHMIITEQSYHGSSTEIINEGGDGNNVNESSLHDCDTYISPSQWDWYQPEKK